MTPRSTLSTLFPYTTLFRTITNFNGKSFDFTANIGVDAVYVKAGAGGSHLYRYDPPSESTGDTNLSSPGEDGNEISHIAFCFDVEPSTNTPTVTATNTSTSTPSNTPTNTATRTP